MKNPVKLAIAAGATGMLVVGLSASAFASPHHHTEAKSRTHQWSSVENDQTSSATTGDNEVGNFFGQANLDLFSFLNNNHAVGVAALSTGDATSGNTASTTVSQTSTSSVTADGGWFSHPEATDHVHQGSEVSNDQEATSDSGDNTVGNAFLQLNANVGSGVNSNSATGIAAASTGDASATNSATTSVTQSSDSTVSSSH